ncbi:MAG: aldehyde dehydrogenase family protein, partial [Pyrinomonadaceae bacterium]|nr:aldehyde dehydrogenase family protein [Pyrinomonadaceae bacterium]
MPIATINPVTGETLQTFESLTQIQLEEKLERAATTFRSYRHTSFAERETLMLGAAELLESDKSTLARLMTIEMGKP